jgi:hypothetical protein
MAMSRHGILAALGATLLIGDADAQDRRVDVTLQGTIPAQCVAQPVRVLVDNGVVHVTQYLRCNHPGRFVIRLSEAVRTQWTGSNARHRLVQRPLDTGVAEFAIAAGAGAEETFVIVPRNPAAAREIARNFTTQLRLQ